MKKYIAYLDDGESVIKVAVPANNAAGVKRYVAGNGEIIKIKDVTDEYPISSANVKLALEQSGFGETEKWLIVRALELTGITEENT